MTWWWILSLPANSFLRKPLTDFPMWFENFQIFEIFGENIWKIFQNFFKIFSKIFQKFFKYFHQKFFKNFSKIFKIFTELEHRFLVDLSDHNKNVWSNGLHNSSPNTFLSEWCFFCDDYMCFQNISEIFEKQWKFLTFFWKCFPIFSPKISEIWKFSNHIGKSVRGFLRKLLAGSDRIHHQVNPNF